MNRGIARGEHAVNARIMDDAFCARGRDAATEEKGLIGRDWINGGGGGGGGGGGTGAARRRIDYPKIRLTEKKKQ